MTRWINGAVLTAGMLLLAFGERLLALLQPYHQDEYKWAIEVDPSTGLTNPVHPPLAEAIYKSIGYVAGYAHLRIVPILFSMVLLVLLYYFARRWWGQGAALVICAVYVVDFFSLLASVQIDIDGVFLPLAALVTFGLYLEALQAERERRRWLVGALVMALIVGFAIKLSYVLVPATLVLHFAFVRPAQAREFLSRKAVRIALVLGVVLLGIGLALVWEKIPFLHYVDKFVAFRGRDLGELAFLTVKGVLYLSPLIAFGLLLGLRYVRRLSLWFGFLAMNVLFYYVLFDFTHTSFDRYLMFLILPGSIITGYALYQMIHRLSGYFIVALVACTAILFALAHIVFSSAHRIVPLIPKSAFVEAFTSLHWNFLIPFTGGSGPIGFYMPVDGLALLWVTAALGAVALLVPRVRFVGLLLFLSASLVYNAFFSIEFLSGHYYGSVPQVTTTLTSYVARDAAIPNVITYNDTGAYELVKARKYGARFYPHDAFIASNIQKFAASSGYYMIVQFPELNSDSGYMRYFNACKRLDSASSGLVTGAVYDCRNVPTTLISGQHE